ncbi:hypothetical protein JYU34_011392 [Plutella xylostella]|uniref:Carbohydrate kinase PfkB domain-containing protein n=1 Tax=Plutella xylostella TaxID=51655 RepID=A0ABQ7QGZ4_PLUXY|nr:hypothetical protein JYU34_011392 [Plutella xylostella]
MEEAKLDGSTHACLGGVCAGGVARNMAEALWRMRGPGAARLLTAVGDDADGDYLQSVAEGMLLDGCRVAGGRTPSYAAVMDSSGECLLGLGDMALHQSISIDLVDKHMDVLSRAPLVVLDGNAPPATVQHVLALCQRMDKPGTTHHLGTVDC